MIPSIAEVVAKFKREWTECLSELSVKSLCRELGLSWRERKLDPATTVELILRQVLHGNVAISHLPHLTKKSFAPGSFSKACARLPLAVFEELTSRITERLQKQDMNQGTWLGHRVFIADGTGISMPEDPSLVEAFGYPRQRRDGTGFPIARLVFAMHLGTGMILKVLINPFRSNEGRECYRFHSELREGDVFLGDRAFCSFAHIAVLLRQKIHAVLRLHQKITADFTPGRDYARRGEAPAFPGQTRSRQIELLGKRDQIVEWLKPGKVPWMSKMQYSALPEYITVREIQYRVSQKGFRTSTITVVTTLLDSKKYPAKKIAALYFKRWTIETNINYLKTYMNMEILRVKSPDNIRKKILAFCIIYNLVRLVMLKAAHKQKVDPARISFSDALRWLANAEPSSVLCVLVLVPNRPGRSKPRHKKRHEKGFHYKLKTKREEKVEWNRKKAKWMR